MHLLIAANCNLEAKQAAGRSCSFRVGLFNQARIGQRARASPRHARAPPDASLECGSQSGSYREQLHIDRCWSLASWPSARTRRGLARSARRVRGINKGAKPLAARPSRATRQEHMKPSCRPTLPAATSCRRLLIAVSFVTGYDVSAPESIRGIKGSQEPSRDWLLAAATLH